MRVAIVGECTERLREYFATAENFIRATFVDSALELRRELITEKIDAVVWVGTPEQAAERALKAVPELPHLVHAVAWQAREAFRLLPNALPRVPLREVPVLILSGTDAPGAQLRRELAYRPGYAHTAHMLNHLLRHNSYVPDRERLAVMQRIFLDQDCNYTLRALCGSGRLERRMNDTAHALGLRSMKPCMEVITAVRALTERIVWNQTAPMAAAEVGHHEDTLARTLDSVLGAHQLGVLHERDLDQHCSIAFTFMLSPGSHLPDLPRLGLGEHPAEYFRHRRGRGKTRPRPNHAQGEREKERERERERERVVSSERDFNAHPMRLAVPRREPRYRRRGHQCPASIDH